REVGFASPKGASDEQPLGWTPGRRILCQRIQLSAKASLHVRLLRAQQAHGISIWHTRPQRFDGSARMDWVDFKRRRHGPQIGCVSSLDRLAHAATVMRVKDENGFSRLRS